MALPGREPEACSGPPPQWNRIVQPRAEPCASKPSKENMKYSREVVMRRGRRKEEMENWKRVLIAGSSGLRVMWFLKRRRAGGFIFGGVALAALASDYPEDFMTLRANLPPFPEPG